MAEDDIEREEIVEIQESADQTVRKKIKISLFWIALGFVFLFCFLTMVFWYVNTKSTYAPLNIYILRETTRSDATGTEGSAGTVTGSSTTEKSVCSDISEGDRLDCYPEATPTQSECVQRGCCFNPKEKIFNPNTPYLPSLGVPVCFYPSDYAGYVVSTLGYFDDHLIATLKRSAPSGFKSDINHLTLVVSYNDDTTLQVKITDTENARYEAPLERNISSKPSNKDKLYDVDLSSDGILTIYRKSSGVKIFDTNLAYLVYSDQFIQLSSKLPSNYVYGLGEHYTSMQKNLNWSRLTFFNKDNFPGPELNLYGTHPFYMAVENDRNMHGIFLLNSNSMDIILQPTPSITYRTIGGILDFFFFLGPSPSAVVKQYVDLVGKPFMPPYWSLGFHLCKYGYNSVNETRRVYQRTRDAGVPYDVQWNDIDYMDRKNDFTFDKTNFKELPDFIDELHQEGMHYVAMFDPGVSNTETFGTYPPYDDGIKDDIFIKDDTGYIFVGKVWNPFSTVFPDFSHPNATSYWTRQFQLLHDSITFDGAWIDMNEISNFYYNGTVNGCPRSPFETPQYLPGGRVPLCTQTLCMTANHYNSIHYNEHNVYGYREAITTNIAMRNITGKRPFVISRATFAGQGQFSGHWSGDIASTWEDMRYSVINMLNFNLYGIPMVGSDICGFRLSTTAELCARWFALGAFYPFARNHNDIDRVEQDPAALGVDVLKSAKNNLFIRYSLLPYLYLLFHRSHLYGETVVRPLFFEFIDDEQTYSIDEQFLWGSNLLIMPALYEGMTEVNAYFPKGIWYDFHTGAKRISNGERFVLPAPLDKINLAIRSGSILVLQHPETTTNKSRSNNFMLYTALDQSSKAVGELYWDDGESIDSYENGEFNHIQFNMANGVLSSLVQSHGYNVTMMADLIRVFGQESIPKTVILNGNETSSFKWNAEFKVLDIEVYVSLLDVFNVHIQH